MLISACSAQGNSRFKEVEEGEEASKTLGPYTYEVAEGYTEPEPFNNYNQQTPFPYGNSAKTYLKPLTLESGEKNNSTVVIWIYPASPEMITASSDELDIEEAKFGDTLVKYTTLPYTAKDPSSHLSLDLEFVLYTFEYNNQLYLAGATFNPEQGEFFKTIMQYIFTQTFTTAN